MNEKKIIVALDGNNLSELESLVDKIKDHVFAFKLGYEFFFNFGLDGYKKIQNKNVRIFLDLKLHDIPNTVQNGIKAICKLKPYFTTIHITGGDDMQKLAVLAKKSVKILGVSVLTSIDKKQASKYYNSDNINNLVKKYLKYALENKLDGIVCSPLEIKFVKNYLSNISIKKKFDIVTPGIRPENSKNYDQKRIMTPKQAIDLGANYLVIGRPITKSSNPLKQIKLINLSIV